VRIKREQLLKVLESVSVGLSTKELLDQSDCFLFGDEIMVFNGEIAARVDTLLDFRGIVKAQPLMTLLRKLKEEEIEVESTEKGLRIKGKNREAFVSVEEQSRIDLKEIEQPVKWKPLPEGLLDALIVACSCCSRMQTIMVLMCVHIMEDKVEASDDFQIVTCPIDTKMKSMLIHRESVEKICSAKPVKWSRTESWMHFQTSDKVTISCRKYEEQYPNVSKYLKVEGPEVKLPAEISSALDKAQIFSVDDPEGNQVTVYIGNGRMRLIGKGAYGSYEERCKIDYSGSKIAFRIEPRLLSEIIRRSNVCKIGNGKIRIDADGFTYVACTAVLED